MAYTTHGWHIPGSARHPAPEHVARCGGINFCELCTGDKAAYDKKKLPDKVKADNAGYNHKPAPIMQFFEYKHLRKDLREISEKFYILAKDLDENLPEGAEKMVAMRKLLEAKDCAVRSGLELER